MHPSASQPSASINHNGIHNDQSTLPASSDDPLNSIRLSFADLSVAGANAYDLGQQHQSQPPQYNYEYTPNAQNTQNLHSSTHSTHQISDIIGGSGGGGGEAFHWGSSGWEQIDYTAFIFWRFFFQYCFLLFLLIKILFSE